MISDEVLGCLGALMLLILVILFEGLIMWGLGWLIAWCFSLHIIFYYWQAVIVALVIHTMLLVFRKGD